MPRPPLPAAGQVSDVLRDIVAGPEFATFGASPRERLIRWFLDTLAEAWGWLWRMVGADGSGLAEIIAVVVALAALLILVRIASRHAPKVLPLGSGEDEEQPPAPVTASQWLRVARRRAEHGAFRPAATALYQGFLLSLEQQGKLSFHSSKTPGDYALEIARGGPDAAAAFTRTSRPDAAERAMERTGPGNARFAGASAGGRFLDSFLDYSFGQDQPTPQGYADLARMARDAGCPAEPAAGGAPDPEATGGAEAAEAADQ